MPSRKYAPLPSPIGQVIPDIVRWASREFKRLSDSILSPDPLWEDLRVSLVAAKTGATNPPEFKKLLDDGAGSVGVFAWHFDATTDEEIFFDVQLPHAFQQYKGVLKPHLHWCPTTTNTGTVKWGLEYSFANFGDAFPATAVVYGQDAASGTVKDHSITKLSDISAEGMAISSVMLCRLFRDATEDTYTGEAAALSFDFHIQLDERGSELEYQKRL